MVAKHGSITRAIAELRLAHPTISGQICEVARKTVFAWDPKVFPSPDSELTNSRVIDRDLLFGLMSSYGDAAVEKLRAVLALAPVPAHVDQASRQDP